MERAVQEAVDEMVATHFPLKSAELAEDTTRNATFVHLLSELLKVHAFVDPVRLSLVTGTW